MREATDIRIRAGEQLRLAIEAAPAGMIVADRAGRMTLVNAEAERLFGYLRPEMLGRSIEILVPPRFRDRRGTLLAGFDFERRTGGTAADPDLCGLRKDGSELPIEVRLNPLDTPEGDFVLCSVVDLTERKQSEARLQGLNAELQELVRERTSELKEREALLHEVHHRVKNNLQVISSLINMQARKLDDPASRAALADCESRVQAMARIHEMLYVSKDYARVPFAEYVRKLTAQVVGVAGSVPALVSVELNLQPVSLPVQLAIPCGLILNELLGNSLNHAFPEKSGGRIRIDLEHTRGRGIQLSVSDDGVGFPKTLLNVQQSFGMQLVETLVDQLEGRLEIVGPPGTTVSVSFPAKTSAIDPGET
jgi:PAS domain S-box-containing protein